MKDWLINDLSIVVLCNKADFFLTKICIASIRYYYPAVTVYIVKDELNGDFSSKELEEKLNVINLDLGLKKYGYCTGKISVLLSEELKHKRVLLIDSDIVFIGKVLDKICPHTENHDFVVTPQYPDTYDCKWFRDIYYDMNWAEKAYPEHEYPGYCFNGGSMVVTPGKIDAGEMIEYVDLSRFPYWTDLSKKYLPCRDQSLLNILLPLKQKRGETTLKPVFFQVWSETRLTGKHEMLQLDIPILKGEGYLHMLEENYDLGIIKKEGYPFLMHWAGAVRIPYLKAMSHSHILYFFQGEYFKKLSFGLLRKEFYETYHWAQFYFKRGIKKIKKNKFIRKLFGKNL